MLCHASLSRCDVNRILPIVPPRRVFLLGVRKLGDWPLYFFAQVKASCRFCCLAETLLLSPLNRFGVSMGNGQVFLLALIKESLTGKRAGIRNPELIP